MKILILNGVNLDMLGKREANIYGSKSLDDLYKRIDSLGLDAEIEYFQSNSEEEIIKKIHSHAQEEYSCGVFNFGAHTHTSVAIRDAILAVDFPFYEVHISNVYSREEFRHVSFFSDIAIGCIAGFGFDGYEFALQKILRSEDGS